MVESSTVFVLDGAKIFAASFLLNLMFFNYIRISAKLPAFIYAAAEFFLSPL